MEQQAHVSSSIMGRAFGMRVIYSIDQVAKEVQIIFAILLASMILTRRRGYKIFNGSRRGYHNSLLDSPDAGNFSDNLLWRGLLKEEDDDENEHTAPCKYPSKIRKCGGITIRTPNSSRFTEYYHSRMLQKFPFLIEMFYWIITFGFYRLTKIVSQDIFAETGIWEVSQGHGLDMLWLEHHSWLSFLFPVTEYSVQQWFMSEHQTALTILNRFYALLHIPGTVGSASPRKYYISTESLLTSLASSPGTTMPLPPRKSLPQSAVR